MLSCGVRLYVSVTYIALRGDVVRPTLNPNLEDQGLHFYVSRTGDPTRTSHPR
jgi:hypothetical protein